MRMRGGTTSRARPAVREAPDQSRQDEAEAIGDDACIDAMTRRIQHNNSSGFMTTATMIAVEACVP